MMMVVMVMVMSVVCGGVGDVEYKCVAVCTCVAGVVNDEIQIDIMRLT
jgi:hypothetical protein